MQYARTLWKTALSKRQTVASAIVVCIFFSDFSICFHCSVKMDCQPNEKFCCCLSLRTGGIVISAFGIMIGVVLIVSTAIQPDVCDTYMQFGIFVPTATVGVSIGGMSITTGVEPYLFIINHTLFQF